MGTGFDCFDERAHTDSENVGMWQHMNRHMLESVMNKHGFVNYADEWWHYTLQDEPFPNTYFDFPIE